ncbi:sulfite exporter TauE/SafE family protein [Segnochrobactrum spirostomi]|uniref:Probable membrane transporter protein n=1 Tax=Segnochrobactrum spirostomi TaxID=2608987 RepID=A0A6A7Y6D7_9HYPH|nr:sulfite exporter TauE/SafE family protein [Segnochrobactrum spirostomi]MQT14366.1 sulfite exporter TauE/SafE family protein [Segnochrobactrum spirostomi]
MEIYLPIAEMPINVLMIVGMGAAVGFISGLFGIGGGFLLTPLLIFSGVPTSVAVATVTPQMIASSASGALTYWRRRSIDLRLSGLLLVSGIAGASAGTWCFALLSRAGRLDVVISVSYMALLGTVGGLMLFESLRSLLRARREGGLPVHRRSHNWIHRMPLKMRFRTSRLYVSVIPVIGIGAGIGFIGALLGVGGGFILVPALIYLLRVPTSIVIGTSLVQTLGTMIIATLLHSVTSVSVDGLLALLMMVGGVIGAQFGAQMGLRMRGEHLRALLGLLVLAVALRFGYELIVHPVDLYQLSVLEWGARM